MVVWQSQSDASGTNCCRGPVSTCQGCFVQHSLTVDFIWEITQNKKRLHTHARTDAETCAYLQASHCACQHVDMKAQTTRIFCFCQMTRWEEEGGKWKRWKHKQNEDKEVASCEKSSVMTNCKTCSICHGNISPTLNPQIHLYALSALSSFTSSSPRCRFYIDFLKSIQE